ncbi:uncharacterized protein TRAVEDRAFT_58002 [Trametes versicolor FP-101664 SS1]|uniref:DUF6699 domain-containing protein n=1 Tax=Trametes pubescens TaxID=154538 RepID=A0A1M2VF59_TRAPU|nr:uncharacterized protein TRAVEDRAFT_58002 [Trametes versicolor FP-101664 SS1]EIW60956.1 hypothetical protein TRAVEDRAFT_58002 [Trametes versicolor FP-101664 SS1]OJT06239.1 hypothetical protein TRAPUB_2920 [Trametes pubescens]
MDTIGKWAAGSSYGPVLSQTDLYLLNADLELNPILANDSGSFQLIFNLSNGQTSGYNPDSRDRDLPFTQKDEPATLPRVEELIIITEVSPWCTIIKNPQGVTLGDVCTTLYKEYSEKMVTEKEFDSLPPRQQEQLRRYAQSASSAGNWQYYSPAPAPPTQYRRADWLREKIFFDRLMRKDAYARQRLGYSAPNIFVLILSTY